MTVIESRLRKRYKLIYRELSNSLNNQAPLPDNIYQKKLKALGKIKELLNEAPEEDDLTGII